MYVGLDGLEDSANQLEIGDGWCVGLGGHVMLAFMSIGYVCGGQVPRGWCDVVSMNIRLTHSSSWWM